MTIAQALKEKNRLISEIKKIKEKINKYNQSPADRERLYDIVKLFDELNDSKSKLVATKTAIQLASEPMRKEVFVQSELKDTLTFLRNIPCENGIVRDRYAREEGYEVNSVYNAKMLDEMANGIEKEIEAIQDALDKFNHTTEVTL
jgi:hypothetical protein